MGLLAVRSVLQPPDQLSSLETPQSLWRTLRSGMLCTMMGIGSCGIDRAHRSSTIPAHPISIPRASNPHHDSIVIFESFQAAHNALYGLQWHTDQLPRMLRAVCKPILAQFTEGLMDEAGTPTEQLREFFRVVDTQGGSKVSDGKISVSDVEWLLHTTNLPGHSGTDLPGEISFGARSPIPEQQRICLEKHWGKIQWGFQAYLSVTQPDLRLADVVDNPEQIARLMR